MIWWFIKSQTAGLWPLVWHFGILFGVMGLTIAYAIFSQMFLKGFFRNTALLVALGTFIVSVTAGIYTRLGENRILAKWAVAEQRAIARGKKARVTAVRKVTKTPAELDSLNRDKK